jgi:hypothetical protein
MELTIEQIELFKALGGLTLTLIIFTSIGYSIKKVVDLIPSDTLTKLL